MVPKGDRSNVPSRSGVLLPSRRDLVYLLSLLVPLVVYSLTLKALSVTSVPGLALNFELVRSDVFFVLGYALFWVGAFAATRGASRGGGLARRVVVVLFHAATVLVVVVTACAHQYFRETGTTLDYGILALWLPQFEEVVPVLASGATFGTWALLAAALLYVVFGPPLVTRAVERGGRLGPRVERSGGSPLGALGLVLLAFGFGVLSLLIGARSTDNPAGASVSFVRAPVVNLALTGAKEATASETGPDADLLGPDVEHPATGATLAPAGEAGAALERRNNVVLIHLESTRARSTTPYNEDLETTPFLQELSEESLLAERAYTVVPHTSKASVAVNCGIEPRLVQPTTEAKPGGIPVPCLADLLGEQGYRTGFFQSSTKEFEDFEGLVGNFGYEEYYPLESMDPEGFEKTNYFGYEDDIMLEPSREWLTENGDEPFLVEYLTGTGHDDYQCLSTRYGYEDFGEDGELGRYLNCIRYQDLFLKNLFDQYEELGLYDETIFVIYGDHGEGFGEHNRFQHDDNMWEEGLRVPLLIHAPGLDRFEGGERIEGLSSQIDVLPTVLELLGYEVRGGEYPGYSLLREPPEDRTLMFGCFHDKACLASLKGTEKYIYHHGNQPDELFDLSEDPMERDNLANESNAEDLAARREALLEWRSKVNATY